MKLIAYCESCSKLLSADDGVVHIHQRTVRERGEIATKIKNDESRIRDELIQKNKAKSGLNLDFYNLGELVELTEHLEEIPPLVPWQVHCNSCNPHPLREHGEIVPGNWCYGCYWWEVGRSADWASLMDWQRHLTRKHSRIFANSNWQALLDGLDSPGKSGLRFA